MMGYPLERSTATGVRQVRKGSMVEQELSASIPFGIGISHPAA